MILGMLFGKNKKKTGKSFFDLNAKEKKRILKKSVAESNELQLDLLKRYEKRIRLGAVASR